MTSQSKVDVWLDGSSAAQLTTPPRSLVDGGESAVIVRTCCLRPIGLSQSQVPLAVDEATAQRLARTCRLEALWWRRIAPAILVLVAVLVIAVVVDGIYSDSKFLGRLLLATIILAVLVATARAVLTLSRSRHHPKLMSSGEVVIRDVHRSAAERWAEVNPQGMIRITR